MKAKSVLFYGLYLNFSISCSEPNSSLSAKNGVDKLTEMNTQFIRLDFAATILHIDKRIENSGIWNGLFADKDFMTIYENSSNYIDSAIQFLNDPKFTTHQKTVCVYSMQKAKLEEIIHLVEQCADLFNQKKIPELLLSRIISPTFGKKKPIVENYSHIEVKRILSNIRDSGKASKELKVMINKILSGEYWRRLKVFLAESNGSN